MAVEIKSVAVIGAGECGRGFALAALLAGYRVLLEDVSENRLMQAVAWIAGNTSAEDRSHLILTSTVEDAVREADLIIEAVAEEMEMKIEMFTIFDKFAKPDAIFASSSLALSIAELAAVTFCPERCLGIRVVATGEGETALEVVRTSQTSDETVTRCQSVGSRMGKKIMVVVE